MRIEELVPLAPFTTFNIGGPARFFIHASSFEDVEAGLEFAREKQLPVFILGGGSNILVADHGFDGLVLRADLQGIEQEDEGEEVRITAGAGVAWDSLARSAVAQTLAGFECLSGVPGTVGGAVVANIGCYGAQCSDTFVSAEVIDLAHPEQGVKLLTKDACDFSYHDSMFCKNPNRYLVLRATFALTRTPVARGSYRDHRFDLAGDEHEPTLEQVRARVLSIRAEKGQLAGPGFYKSAGSFFHMPFVSGEVFERVQSIARELDAEKEERLRPWAWPQPDGSHKLAPGFLLEYTEFKKGYVRGAAGISPTHTLTVVNHARATAKEIAELARDMRTAVQSIFGVQLEREVEYVGEI